MWQNLDFFHIFNEEKTGRKWENIEAFFRAFLSVLSSCYDSRWCCERMLFYVFILLVLPFNETAKNESERTDQVYFRACRQISITTPNIEPKKHREKEVKHVNRIDERWSKSARFRPNKNNAQVTANQRQDRGLKRKENIQNSIWKHNYVWLSFIFFGRLFMLFHFTFLFFVTTRQKWKFVAVNVLFRRYLTSFV